MYPDTTGNAFDGGTPPPPTQRPVGVAWIPAQRSPWEPPPRSQNNARPQNERPAPVESDSTQSPVDSDSTQSPVDSGPARPWTEPADLVAGSGRTEPAGETAAGGDGAAGEFTGGGDADGPDTEAGAADTEAAEVAEITEAAEVAGPAEATEAAEAAEAAEVTEVTEAAEVAEATPDDMGVVDLLTRADDGPAPMTDRYVPATDEPASDVPATDVPASDVPASDAPASDVLVSTVPAAAQAPAGPLRPGDVDETRIALWADASVEAEAFRTRIREAGNLFVDDPNFAVTAAAAVVTDAVNALAAALQHQHAELDPRRRSDNPDTESLRVAVRRYREFLDRVLAL